MGWLRRLTILLLAATACGRAAALTTVNFEGFADGSVLDTQLAGMVFANTVVLTAGIGLNELEFPPRSGANVATDNGGAIEISFGAPQQSWSGYLTYGVAIQVRAFDSAGGTLLAQTASLFAANSALSGDPGSSPNERLEVLVPGGFSFLSITGDPAGGSFVLDDVSISAVPEPATTVLLAAGCGLLLLRLRRRLALAGAAVLLAGPGLVAAQTVALPLLSPAAVHIGTPTQVLVSAKITQANVLPGGVNVLRVAGGGQATVAGTLNDNGSGGDALAGDGVYAGRIVVSESIEGGVNLRLSVAVRGSLRRLQSPSSTLAVVPVNAPIGLTPPDLAQRATDPASGAAIVANIVNACFTNSTPYAAVSQVATLVGGIPAGRFSEIGNCYQLTISPGGAAAVAAAVATLSARPEVRYAEPEAITRGAACSGPICGDPNYTTVLRLPQAHQLGTGAGVVIGILDSGIDAARIPGINLSTVVLGSNFSSSGPAGIPRDDNGHGTLVAYIAQETAPGATLVISKVLNANLEGSETSSLLGIREAVLNGAQIVNMSLSSRLQSFVMRDAITTLQNAGLIVIAAAGNEGSSIREYPAAHVGAVAVGNVDDRDARYSGPKPSNFGPWVNLAAPGVNIAGLGMPGTGTSFSTPFVTGTAALIRAKFPGITRPALISHLLRTTLPIAAQAGQDTCPAQPCNQDLGSGRLDVEAALGAIRITRSTAVGASGAAFVRTIEVELATSAGAVLYSELRGFFGQSTGCEVATVKNPPCISSLPFDFAALAPGSYRLRLSFRDPTASFFGSVQLNAPGAVFSAVQSGTATIRAGDPTQADFSLFGAGVRTVFLQITKS